MSLAMQSKKMCEDIIASHSMRGKTINRIADDVRGIFRDTGKTMKGFTSDREKMSAELRNNLSGFTSGLKKDVGNMIGNFHKDREEMANNLRKDFSNIRDSLNNQEIARFKDFKAMIGDIQKDIKKMRMDIKEFEKQVQGKLVEFSGAHSDMGKQLRKELSKYVSGIVNETGLMMKGYADDRKGMAANMKEMNAALSGKKGMQTAPEAKPEMEAESAHNVMKSAKPGKKGRQKTKKK